MDNSIDSSLNLAQRKLSGQIKHKSYEAISGTFDHLKNQRKLTVHRSHIEKIQQFDNDLVHSDPTTISDEYDIEKIRGTRNDLLQQRERLLTENPNLRTNLGHLEVRHNLTSNASLLNKQEETKRSRHPHYKVTRENHLAKNDSETGLHVDRVSSGISLENKRIPVKTNSHIQIPTKHPIKHNTKGIQRLNRQTIPHYKVREKHNIAVTNSDKQINVIKSPNGMKLKDQRIKLQKKQNISLSNENEPTKRLKNVSIKKTTDKYKFSDKAKANQNKAITEKKKDLRKIKQRSRFGSPLTSSSVGQRTKTQKLALAPSKAISSLGGNVKDSFNRDIEENEMTEGVQFANAVISPMASKLRFETNSLVAKRVGFDRKAYNLSKVEKKIMKTDKQAYKAKMAQRKSIRKKAERKARATIMAQESGNAGIMARGRALASQSWKQIKDKAIKSFQAIIAKIASSKLLISGSGLLLVAIIPAVVFMPIMMMTGGGALTGTEPEQNLSFSIGALSPEVLQHEQTVLEELQKIGLEEYKDLVLVLIHLETKGALPDVMQSSESLGLPPNSITDPRKSIEAGVNHLANGIEMMNSYGVDIQTLIQAYNFGNAFIPYVASNGGAWSQSLSDEFSRQQANKLGWSSYGDPNYVSKAMQHLSIEDGSVSLNVSFDLENGQLAIPAPSAGLTSHFGWRIHPIEKIPKLHTGTDFAAPFGTPILAAADGVVVEAGSKGGYGLTVVIDHGSGIQTLYAHSQKLLVKAGQTVKAGQQISEMGSTGSSTGSHLHFEVRVNGEYRDPINWLPN